MGAVALWVVLAGHAMAATSSPTVFRCTVNGQTVYQQGACSEGRALALEAAPTAAARQAQDQDTARLQHAALALEADRLRRDGRASTARTRLGSAEKSKSQGRGQTAAMGTAPTPAPPAKPKKLPKQH
jgi:hypothetical protein